MTLFYLGLAWLLGIALAEAIRLPWWAWLIGVPIGAVSLFLLRSRSPLRLAAVAIILLFFGAARYSVAIPHPAENDISLYNDQGHVILTGVISNAPEIRDTSAAMLVEARSIQRDDGASQQVTGLVQ